MTPTCVNRTDKPPKYRIEQHGMAIIRSVQDDDGQEYRQQLNEDGLWSEWHDGDWEGDGRAVLIRPGTISTTTAPLPGGSWIPIQYVPVPVPTSGAVGMTTTAANPPKPEAPKGWLGRTKG